MMQDTKAGTADTITYPVTDEFDLAIVLAAAPTAAAFIYERISSNTRCPQRTLIGFGRSARHGPAPSQDLDGLRAGIAAGGMVFAFLSYEALTGSPCHSDTPRQLVLSAETLVDIDHECGRAIISGAVDDGLISALTTARPDTSTDAIAAWVGDDDAAGWKRDRTEAEFVRDAQSLQVEMASRGNVAGAVLSVALSRLFDGRPLDAYLALRRLNPSTCMFFVEDGDFSLWGSTSLPVMRVREDRITAETDGATRRVAPGESAPWEPDAKEIAEYDLVVEALRSDLYGVIDPASLSLVVDREPRQYFNLQHLFAEIEGTLAPGVDMVEALSRLTPHGAATGFPKAAAISLIDRFDARPRGPYAGTVGVFGSDGFADAACVIRSAWTIGDRVHTRAGAKIVPASDPAAEYHEGVLKTLPMRRSVADASIE